MIAKQRVEVGTFEFDTKSGLHPSAKLGPFGESLGQSLGQSTVKVDIHIWSCCFYQYFFVI